MISQANYSTNTISPLVCSKLYMDIVKIGILGGCVKMQVDNLGAADIRACPQPASNKRT